MPDSPASEQLENLWGKANRFEFSNREERYNHNVFRYPAKFHPPVASALIEKYSNPGDLILDPFSGSGTLLVEAIISGRNAVGTDIDPLAVFISEAKITRYDTDEIQAFANILVSKLNELRFLDESTHGSFTEDVSVEDYGEELGAEPNYVPDIPKLSHWFRRRVILQLSRILTAINEIPHSREVHVFFHLCFAAIIRNSSNADPVPVSGLEVTKHMIMREQAGRIVDPYQLMIKAIKKTLVATSAFLGQTLDRHVTGKAFISDARDMSRIVPKSIDTVITSPPYLTAVDYYRRHQLEMFWLNMVASQADRLTLLPGYIGRHGVSATQLKGMSAIPCRSRLGRQWLRRLEHQRPAQARSLFHYATSMAKVLDQMLEVVKKNGRVVMVVGDSQVQGETFPTGELIAELAPRQLVLTDVLWYPLENRFMSYTRKNGADIKIEQVLVFERG